MDPADLLSPEEERDAVLAEKAVVAQNGQDHKQYVEYLEKELQQMEPAMNPLQRVLFHKLIQSHVELFKQELQQHLLQQAQMMQAQAMQQGQGGQSNSGNMINRGQTQNTTPFNQTGAPSTASMAKGVGG
jgi:small-conductance mechanosensitive channel